MLHFVLIANLRLHSCDVLFSLEEKGIKLFQGAIFHEEEGIILLFLIERRGLCCPKEKRT
jgi:hypothetical protein